MGWTIAPLNNCLSRLESRGILSWLVLLVSTINVIFVGGKRRCFGQFVSALHEAYNGTSMVELNWIGDSYAALAFFLMPVITGFILAAGRIYRLAMTLAAVLILVSCFTSASVPSPAWLFLTHTLLHGLGSSLILCTTALVTGEYFDKSHRWHVLATSLISGGPFGALIFGPLFSVLIQHLGWRAAFQIVGVMFFVEILLGALVFKPREFSDESGMDSDRLRAKKKRFAMVSWAHMRANPQIFCWFAHRVTHNVMMYGLLMNLTDFLTDQTGNLERGARLSLMLSSGESLTFTIGALVGDRLRGFLPFIYMLGSYCLTVAFVVWQFVYDMITVGMAIAFLVGATISVGNTFLYATAEEVMRVEGGVAYPATKMAGAFGMLLAPQLSGGLIDLLGYRGFFVSMAIFASLNMGLFIALNWLLLYKSRRAAEEDREEPMHDAEMEVLHEKSRVPNTEYKV